MNNQERVSVVIPAKNESGAIGDVVSAVLEVLPNAELIVVNDGSSDDTASVAEKAGAKVVHHPYSMGNGAAIKSGVRSAKGDVLVFMDGDGQHSASDIPELLEKLRAGYDLVVGARTRGSQASVGRGLANKLYNRLSSYMTGQRVEDLTSGFRAARAENSGSSFHSFQTGFHTRQPAQWRFSEQATQCVMCQSMSVKGLVSAISILSGTASGFF